MFVGAKVRDVEDGDIGTVTKSYYETDLDGVFGAAGWWVLWETGEFAGEELWSEECFLELIEE